jgi:acetyltransferase-like isoleucine patch superfamily enzyme
MNIAVFLFKGSRKLFSLLRDSLYTPVVRIIFFLNGAKIGSGFRSFGIPRVLVTRRGLFTAGKKFRINSGNKHNVIGRQQKCIFWVDGNLSIGHNVGISASAIICTTQIEIGDNVNIGGNTVIYDTDFHSLDPKDRAGSLDREKTKKAPVTIKNNAFIGAHTTILKGTTIGENSVIGACSVVTGTVPANEVWAGNPARIIRKL